MPVTLEEPEDLSFMYFPPCVELERCSGFCLGQADCCQPRKIDAVPVRVAKLYRKNHKKNSTEVLLMERHLECDCGCSVKAKDCNPTMQDYSPDECRCRCKNVDQERKCKFQSNKIWDTKNCKCHCREPPAGGCTTGLRVHPDTCMCTISSLENSKQSYPDDTYTFS